MRASIKRWSFMVENKKVAAIKSSDECHALALDRQVRGTVLLRHGFIALSTYDTLS